MTKPETICECEHPWEIHNHPENRENGFNAGCLHKYEDGEICGCEQFHKDKTILKVSSDPEETIIDGVVS